MAEVKRIGVLTGGGDAPGLNPAIKGLVYRASERGIETVGLSDGWLSLLDPPFEVVLLNAPPCDDGIATAGPTRLIATNPFQTLNELGDRIDKSAEVIANIEKLGLMRSLPAAARDTLGLPRDFQKRECR